MSQIDLGPTLLSLTGISSEHPMLGHDLTQLPLDHPGRAIMQFGDNQAYMEGERVVVLHIVTVLSLCVGMVYDVV